VARDGACTRRSVPLPERRQRDRGRTIVDGRSFEIINGGTLAFGETIYITIVPYTYPAAGGTALPSIHIRGSYQTFAKTKSVSYSRSAWINTYTFGSGPFGIIWISGPTPTNPAMSSGGLEDLNMGAGALAVGCLLHQVDFDIVWNSTTTPLGNFGIAVYLNNALIDYDNSFSNIGAQTISIDCADTAIATGDSMMFDVLWNGPAGGGPADASQAEIHDVTVTYIMPTPDKAV
jgi:hypothetical protein